MVLVRHAERADENPGAPLSELHPGRVGTAAYPECDPPLTSVGAEQASLAANHFANKLGTLYAFDGVYVSPFIRCVQTAYPFARELNLPLIVHSRAGVCAWAYKKALRDYGRPPVLLSESQLRGITPKVELSCDDPMPPVEPGFISFLEQLARICPGTVGQRKPAVLVLTHREGIRELDQLCGVEERMATPYCVVREYDYKLATSSFTLVRNSTLCVVEALSLYSADGIEGKTRNRQFAFA